MLYSCLTSQASLQRLKCRCKPANDFENFSRLSSKFKISTSRRRTILNLNCKMGYIRGVLFDKDGTLVDYHQTWLPLNRLAAKRIARENPQLANLLLISAGWVPHIETDHPGTCTSGSPLVAGNCREIAEVWWRVLPENLRQLHGTCLNVEIQINNTFCQHLANNVSPVCDLPNLFQDLRNEGLYLGVATNDSEEGAHNTLKPLNVPHMLDFICGYDSGYGAKPTPGMVQGFCSTVGISTNEVAVVGDSVHDLEMGKRAGAGLLVGVLTGTATAQDLEPHAHVVLSSIMELKEFLKTLDTFQIKNIEKYTPTIGRKIKTERPKIVPPVF
mmetsp:Transcript_34486/g.47786  ORF Transcript_34486/g.47786 Transcript_34486/m.47786 type:complete len:329 (-) Transcript_34486:159-1145(-)